MASTEERFEKGLREEDPAFGEDLLSGIRENLRATEKAASRDVAGLLAVVLLAWLLTSGTTDKVELSIAGISLNQPGALLTLLPLVAAYMTISFCESIINILVYLDHHNMLFKKLHPKAWESGLDGLLIPSSYIPNIVVSKMTEKGRVYEILAIIRLLAPLLVVAAGNAFIIWASLTRQVDPITLTIGIASGVAALFGIALFIRYVDSYELRT